jgi:hypothetical protein
LTKDPGAKLNRKNTLHDLLLRFRPYHWYKFTFFKLNHSYCKFLFIYSMKFNDKNMFFDYY